MTPLPNNLPYWMQLSAFIASGLLASFTILGIVIQLCKKPKLKFRLTREIFFRITDVEAIFANAVLVSENSGIFIDTISFELKKVDNPMKSFPLSCAYIGEKVRGFNSPISDFNWYSTSPVAYIPVVIPQRISYLLVQQSYAESMKREFMYFRSKVLEALRVFKETPVPLAQEQKEIKVNELYQKAAAIVSEHMSKIMECIQIEGGRYQLEAKIFYKIKRWIFLRKQQVATSIIAFNIDSNVKDTLRADLALSLQTISINLITGENRAYKNPEYSPIEIQEL